MSTRAFAGAAALLISTAPAAWADLTAEGLWADWQETYGRMGIGLTAEEEVGDGALTLTDLTVAIDMAGTGSTVNYGTVTLTEQGDGTVRIDLPAETSITSEATVEGETVTQDITMTHEALEMIASEDGDTRTYAITADSLRFDMEDASGGEAVDPIGAVFTLEGVDTTTDIVPDGEALTFDQVFAAAAFDLAMDGGTEAQPFAATYRASDLSGTGTGRMAGTAVAEAATLAELGLDFDTSITHGGAETRVEAMTDGGPFGLEGSSTGGEIVVGLTPDGLTETFSSSGAEARMQFPQFPVPVSISMQEFLTGFTVPVGTSEDTKPFGLDLAMRQLILDDTLWNLFDPTGQLPRDAATVVVDLDGEAVMNVDIFGDPEALAAASGPPGEVKALTIGDVTVEAAGAALRATGDLTFPTPDLTAPVGQIDLALDGAFALVDRLVALGFIPAQQAAFAKGMAGAVARPVGEDQLESTIQFNEDGTISANGLPLQ